SLSSCDYRQIETLIARLQERFASQVSISLPSLRVDSFSLQMADMVQERRRSGLTFAPEAGTQRLRDAINKKVSEEALLGVAEAAFGRKWQRLKLYFMIGLPTETDEDVQGIVALAKQVLAIGRRYHGGRARVSISVATFVPKPHTPFQWAALADDADVQRRQGILRAGLRGPGLELSWHDQRMTYLEALLARGDRRLASVVHRAWQLGAGFDAWDEQFRWDAWQQALQESGIAADDYARRERSLEEPMPWEFIEIGVPRSHLEREYKYAFEGRPTPALLRKRERGPSEVGQSQEETPSPPQNARASVERLFHTYEVHFARGQAIKYISHLDMVRAWERMLRRAGLPVAYSAGFNPRPKLAFAAPLPVGVLADDDVAEFALTQELPAAEVAARLCQQAVPGLNIRKVVAVPDKRPALQARMREALYAVAISSVDVPVLREKVTELLAREHLFVSYQRQERLRAYDLRPLIIELGLEEGPEPILHMRLRHDPQATGRPGDVLQALGIEPAAAEITRTELVLAPESLPTTDNYDA
ncbi:MAG: TIGR03936 family radical SAM-associated protein, partial [Anaerolineae bacterium]